MKFFSTSILLLVFSSLMLGQTSRSTGDLQGSVVDATGAAVPSATVKATNTANSQSRSQLSDPTGQFHLRELPSGEYMLEVTREGFHDRQTHVTIAVGSTIHMTVELAPASVTQQVTVSAESSALDPSQTSIATNIDPERIEESPVRSRNYLNFALLAPGVNASNANGPSGVAALPSSGFTFGGLRPRSNAIYIDGVDNNDEFTGASRTELSLETVREFQVVNQGLSAEAGGAAGGSINVVTKAGANTLHGDLFVFVENGALDARPAFEGGRGKPDLNRSRVGVSVGGPIRKNKTFYYTGFEQEHAQGQAASDISADAIAALNPFLQQGNILGIARISNSFFPVSRNETEASLKIDHQVNANTSLAVRYAFTNNREVNDAFNTADLVDRSSRGSSFTEDHSFAGGLTQVFGPDLVNDLRFQLATRRVNLRNENQNVPGFLVPGVVEFGRPYSAVNLDHENHYEISDSISRAYGKHLLKAGAGFNRIHVRAAVPDGFNGLYVFRTVDDLLAGSPAYFQQAFGNPDTNFAVNRYSGFLQDHWSATAKLSIDAGVRYDFEQLPAQYNQDTNNFSPRIGIAFVPAPNWVVRSGFAIFFDRYPLAFVNQALEKNGIHSFDQVVDTFVSPISYPIQPRSTPIAGVAPSIYRPQPGMANPYSEVATFGVEHAVTRNLSASATYSFVRGLKMPRMTNVNLLPPVPLSPQNALSIGVPNPDPQQLGRNVFSNQRIDPSFDSIVQLGNTSASTYHGLTLTANRRLANEFELLASYTWSKAIDDASDFTESPQNPYDLRAERSVSLNNQAHRVTLSALFDLPIGDEEEGKGSSASEENVVTKMFSNIEVAPILTIGSGRPVDPLTGFDSSRTHMYPLSSRPLGYARDSLSTPTTAVLDMRILKFFKVGEHGKFDIVAEGFNLFNRTNISQLNPYFGYNLTPLSSFGVPMEARNKRQLQFSLDFEF